MNTGDLRIALECSDIAADLALSYFRAGVEATAKRDGTPVTEADRATERALVAEVGERCPGDAFLGEEYGSSGDSERVWIIDPIDGTSMFAAADRRWRVHLALEVSGELEVAVVTAPAMGVQWWAARGEGTFEAAWPGRARPRRLRASATGGLDAARLTVLRGADRDRLPTHADGTTPAVPGWGAGLAGVVRGDSDAYLADRYDVWDHAPWVLLVEEAGGRFTAAPGARRRGDGGGLYSNHALHDRLVAHLGWS